MREPSQPGEPQDPARDGRRAAHHRGGACRHCSGIGAEHDIRVEHRHEGVEVAAPRGRQERVDNRTLTDRIGVGNRGSLQTPACATGQLPGGRGCSLHDRGDVLEGHREHVVEHERQSLGGGKRAENDEQCKTHRIGQHRLVFGVAAVCPGHDRVGDRRVQWIFPPCPA
jgi:hypothetical protein